MNLNNLYLISAIINGFLFPAYAIWNGKRTRQQLIKNPSMKLKIFRDTGIILIVLTIISIAPFLLNNENLEVIGLNFLNKPIWIIGLFSISIIITLVLKSIKLNKKNSRKFYEANKTLNFLMPNTLKELRLTIVVSFIAGICEEIIYRGFLFWYLSQFTPTILAIILANIPFALGHLTTTGKKNTFGAFVLAFIFSGAYLLTKSLWLPILLHIIVDLYSMIFAYKSYQVMNEIKIQPHS